MANFLAELKRRHIYRVAAAYAVVAWVSLQLVNNLIPALNLPNSAATLILVLLAVGFPIVLIFAWVRELAPVDGTTGRAVTSKMDWALMGALVVVIALASYQQLTPMTGVGAPQQANIASKSPTLPSGIVSIAVLPFANMSGDAGQDFFSDGMTEEINAALAKVADLHVIARTSAFQFKGQNQDVRNVGQALGASHLIEGSVRKAGERVRITAQLVRAGDGVQLWSENYDRNLTDIFAIQEDIAQAIAAALRIPLGLQQGDSLVPNRTGDLESYQQYLLARTLVRARGTSIAQAVAILEPLVVRDPGFAPAWALLAYAYYLTPAYGPLPRTGAVEEARRFVQSSIDKAEMAARHAIQLDSKNAGGYAALAIIEVQHEKWADAEDLFGQALALDPNDPDTLNVNRMLPSVGRLKESLAASEKLRMLEPFVPSYNITTADIMMINGQGTAAIRLLEATQADAAGGYYRNVGLAKAYAAAGRYAEAADTLLLITGNQVSRRSVEDAARLLREAPAKVKAPEALPTLEGELGFVYAHVGTPERVLEFPERGLEIGYVSTPLYQLWLPEYALLRKTERFKAFMRKAGIVDYWRARGWPDLCHPTTGDDFECN